MPELASFSTPADIQDLQSTSPEQQNELNSLWSTNVDGFTQQAITGDPWNMTGESNQTSYYNPLNTNIPAGTNSALVSWNAFPNRMTQYLGNNQPSTNPYNLNQTQLWQLADTGYYTDNSGNQQTFPQIPSTLCPQPDWSGQLQPYGPYGPRGWMDEYCEWSVTRDPSTNKITRVDFVCENPEYWQTLWKINQAVAAQKMQDALNYGLPSDSPNLVQVSVEDLQLLNPATGQPVIDPSTGMAAYNPLNKWNTGPSSVRGNSGATGGAIHLTSTPNTLQTELGLAGGATVLRTIGNSNPQTLICCSQYGQPFRHSDPHIGQTVNQVISAGFIASLADPVGLYIQMPDFSGYTLPSDPNLPTGASASDCWMIARGSENIVDPITGQNYPGNFILHAVFQIPESWIEAGVKFTVSDIQINFNGNANYINYGAQITDTFNIGLFARPISAPVPAAQNCVTSLSDSASLAQPVQMMFKDLWDASFNTNIPNVVNFPMNLASNTVIVAPIVLQGQSGLSMVLTCSTATAGPKGQLPMVSVPGNDISFKTVAMTNITYAAPGNSYPSEFQLLTLLVSVDNNSALGLRSIYVTNYGQEQGQAGPAYLNVVAPIIM